MTLHPAQPNSNAPRVKAPEGEYQSPSPGEYSPVLAQKVLALTHTREAYMRRIAERKRGHRGYRDLESKLIGATVKQLRAEIRSEKRSRS